MNIPIQNPDYFGFPFCNTALPKVQRGIPRCTMEPTGRAVGGVRIRLIQRDHPSPQINDWGISHRDPYFDACWRAVLPDWTSHTIKQAAALTMQKDRLMTWEQFCQALHPDHPAVAKRPDVVFGALQQADAVGIGYARRNPSGVVICA